MNKKNIIKKFLKMYAFLCLDILFLCIGSFIILGALYATIKSIIGIFIYDEKFIWSMYTLCSLFVIVPLALIVCKALEDIREKW